MLEFGEIFDRAIFLFDDPDIRGQYETDPVGFQMSMRPYLINGKDEITHPVAIADKLAVYSSPQGSLEEFDGNDTTTYTLSTQPADGAVFSYRVNGDLVSGCSYNAENRTVTFPFTVKTGDKASVAWYYAGAFTSDMTDFGFRGDFNTAAIAEKVKNLLAYSVAFAWSTNEMNRALEIRNILSDADLSFYSPANSAQAKVEWHNAVKRMLDSLEAQLGWRIYATPKGGSRFGK